MSPSCQTKRSSGGRSGWGPGGRSCSSAAMTYFHNHFQNPAWPRTRPLATLVALRATRRGLPDARAETLFDQRATLYIWDVKLRRRAIERSLRRPSPHEQGSARAAAARPALPTHQCDVIDGQWEFQSSAFDNASPEAEDDCPDDMSIVLGDTLASLNRSPEALPAETPWADEQWGVAVLEVGYLRHDEQQTPLRTPEPSELAHGDICGKKAPGRRKRLKKHAEWLSDPPRIPPRPDPGIWQPCRNRRNTTSFPGYLPLASYRHGERESSVFIGRIVPLRPLHRAAWHARGRPFEPG